MPEGCWEWCRIDGTLKRPGMFRLGDAVGARTAYDAEGQPCKTTQR